MSYNRDVAVRGTDYQHPELMHSTRIVLDRNRFCSFLIQYEYARVTRSGQWRHNYTHS